VGGEELQQLVLHVREVERLARERGLVRLEVQHQVAVFDEFGGRAPTGAPHEVAQSRLEFLWVKRIQTEVVEEIFAIAELGQLGSGDQQQERFQYGIALAEGATDRKRALGVGVGDDDGAGPAVSRLVGRRDRGVGYRLPRVTAEVQRLDEERGGRIGEDQDRFGHLRAIRGSGRSPTG
jgi:hypothetical protein